MFWTIFAFAMGLNVGLCLSLLFGRKRKPSPRNVIPFAERPRADLAVANRIGESAPRELPGGMRLDWRQWPSKPGPHFIWMGDKMEIKDVVVVTKPDADGVPRPVPFAKSIIGGKNDGEPLIPVKEYGARLWAGPIEPPILPPSEAELVKKLKGIK